MILVCADWQWSRLLFYGCFFEIIRALIGIVSDQNFCNVHLAIAIAIIIMRSSETFFLFALLGLDSSLFNFFLFLFSFWLKFY